MNVVRPDEARFRELVESHRGNLRAYCQRMLGSAHDADDAVQETLLRAWRGLLGFRGNSSVKTWLYRIATNVCVDMLARRRRSVLRPDGRAATLARVNGAEQRDRDDLPYAGHPVTNLPVSAIDYAIDYGNDLRYHGYPGTELPTDPEASYEQREELELALFTTLTRLPRMQGAALMLRDVVGLSAKETADSLHTTVASVNSALSRARAAVDQGLPERGGFRPRPDRRLRQAVERFADSFEEGDIGEIVTMLNADTTFADVAKRTAIPQRVDSGAAA
jgi:RNA polymerase sigma-70 factor (ECF subfamily)